MSALDEVARLLALVPWLLERPGASVREIADAFGVAEDTVREDLAQLDFCGLPGLGGGHLFEVTVVGDRVLLRMAEELRRPLRLTPREALRLILTLDAVAAALGDEVPALRSAVGKVRAAAGVPAGVAVELDPAGGRWLGALRRAIADGRRVRLRYRGRGDAAPLDRHVDPWALHVREGVWYLQGHDHAADALRTFRLDRAVDVEVTDAAIDHPRPSGELPPPRYVRGPDDVEVELELAPAGRWLADAVDPEDVEALGDRWRIRFHTDALPWIERLLLAAGDDVRVVRPAALARRVKALAAEAVARYRREPPVGD